MKKFKIFKSNFVSFIVFLFVLFVLLVSLFKLEILISKRYIYVLNEKIQNKNEIMLNIFSSTKTEKEIEEESLFDYEILSAQYNQTKINLNGLKIINRILSKLPKNICDLNFENMRKSYFFSTSDELNDKFDYGESKFALATFISSNDDKYMQMARVLLYSYKKVMKLNVDFIAIVIEGNLSNDKQCLLKQVGWKIVEVERIQSIKTDKNNRNQWKDVFTKLQIAKFIEYQNILFLDADCLVMRNVDELFYLKTDFAATLDFSSGYLGSNINIGVFVIRPSLCLYYTLLSNMKKVNQYGYFYEQDYFNWLMKYKMIRLSLKYNAMHTIFSRYLNIWNKELRTSYKIIHFTMIKPLSTKSTFLIEKWSKIQNETNSEFPLHLCPDKKK